jgi:hypothetical protein
MAHRKKEGGAPLHNELKDLNYRLNEATKQKTGKSSVVPLWAKSAAAIALLIFLGYLTNQLLLKKNPGPGEIAKKEEKSPATAEQDTKKEVTAPAADSVHLNADEKQPINEPTAPPKENDEKRKQLSSKTASSHPGRQNAEKKIAVDSGKPERNTGAQLPQPSVSDDLKSAEVASAPKLKPLAASAMVPNEEIFLGVVIDANNMPVQGAVIKMVNNNKATITDQQGEFRLGMKHKDPKLNLEVNAEGYEPRKVEVAPSESGRNIILLHADSGVAQEIVVNKSRANQLKESKPDQLNSIELNESLAVPIGGWQKFYDYLNKNKKINTADSSKRGTEIISFLVNVSGKLSSFQSLQSISNAHHAEAIWLIKNGPSWTCLKDKKQRITIYIDFN